MAKKIEKGGERIRSETGSKREKVRVYP